MEIAAPMPGEWGEGAGIEERVKGGSGGRGVFWGEGVWVRAGVGEGKKVGVAERGLVRAVRCCFIDWDC